MTVKRTKGYPKGRLFFGKTPVQPKTQVQDSDPNNCGWKAKLRVTCDQPIHWTDFHDWQSTPVAPKSTTSSTSTITRADKVNDGFGVGSTSVVGRGPTYDCSNCSLSTRRSPGDMTGNNGASILITAAPPIGQQPPLGSATPLLSFGEQNSQYRSFSV